MEDFSKEIKENVGTFTDTSEASSSNSDKIDTFPDDAKSAFRLPLSKKSSMVQMRRKSKSTFNNQDITSIRKSLNTIRRLSI